MVTFAAGAPQARGGQLVALAITSEHRSRAFADVPTAAETIAPGFVQTTVGLDGKGFARLFDRTVDTFADIARERNIAAGD